MKRLITSHGLTERGCCRFSGFTTTAYPLRVRMFTDETRMARFASMVHRVCHESLRTSLLSVSIRVNPWLIASPQMKATI